MTHEMRKLMEAVDDWDRYDRYDSLDAHGRAGASEARSEEIEGGFCDYVRKELSGRNRDYYIKTVPLAYKYLSGPDRTRACHELLHLPFSGREYDNLLNMIEIVRNEYRGNNPSMLNLFIYAESLLLDNPLYNAMYDLNRKLEQE